MTSRNAALRRLAACAALAAAGCGTALKEPAATTMPPERARVVRIGYPVGGGHQYVDVDLPLDGDPTAASEPGGAGTHPAFVYEVAGPGERSAVVTSDGGPLLPLAREALEGSMKPPRRVLEWHAAALARILLADTGSAGRLGGPRERSILLRQLDATPDSVVLAEALFQFDPRLAAGEHEAHAGDDRIALRLVHLVREARLGSRRALDETFRLSLEYFSALPLFTAAAVALFPRTLNAELHAAHPPGPDGPSSAAFLQAIRAGLRGAAHESGALAWKLAPTPAPAGGAAR